MTAARHLLRCLGLPMVCVAMFSLLGGHWAVFQGIAWAQMLRDYSQNATLAEAVEKTFSGDAPCSMCKMIAEEKQKEEKAPATVKVEKKAEIFLESGRDLLPAPASQNFSHQFPGDLIFASRSHAPSDPVPISAT
jgi:hypothetical protein